MAADDSFVPTPSWLTQPFWDNAQREVLSVQVCADCQNKIFPPQFACPSCLGTDWEWVPSRGRGTIYSFTEAHLDPIGRRLAEPTLIADVDLDEGWHIMTNIVDASPSDVSIGSAVEVVWRRLSPEINLPLFRLAR
jgi:uncharacterized protein